MRKPEHQRDPQYIAENLREENARLLRWIDSDVKRFAVVRERAAEVRALAHGLVDEASRQGAERQSREEELHLAKQRVHLEFDALPTTAPHPWVYLAFGANPALTRNAWGRDWDYRWERWVKDSDYWEEIEREAENLIAAARDQFARYQEARAAAERALWGMDRTVRHALAWSATCFRDGETAPVPGPRPTKASAAPLTAFLLVALIGIPVAPTAVAVGLGAAFLVVVVALSVRSVVGSDRRAVSVATLAGGSSLALFSAAYLLVRGVHPHDLLQAGAPISSIAEAAFTSLTVGITGGTIGIDLGGAARIVAFIQILLTVAAVASGITVAWRRLVERSETQRTPTPQVEDTG